MSLIEMMLFGGIASFVLITIIGVLAKGTNIIELGRRTSGSTTDMRVALELLTEDVAEIVNFEGTGDKVDLASGALTFVIHSSRAEKGMSGTGLRKVEWKLSGAGKLKDVVRTVTAQGGSGGSSGPVTLVKEGIAKFAVWPMAATPVAGAAANAPHWKLAIASGGHQPGATPACVLVELAAGEVSGDKAIEGSSITKVVTKLWCRNRVLELARGALQ